MKKRIVVYGLGQEYRRQQHMIRNNYEIVAITDRKEVPEGFDGYEKYVLPAEIGKLDFDYVYVTSTKYFSDIKADLITKYGIPDTKVISIKNQWWYIPNSEIRDKWVIDRISNIKPGSKILDAGAGNCRYKRYCNHLEYVSQDFGQYDESEKKEGILNPEKWESQKCDIISDITEIPVEDSSFDVVLCTEVFEHIKNPILALKEFSRVLRKGGILILTAPFCSLTHMAPYYYSNGFSKYWYQELLKDNGFVIKSITSNGNYFMYLAQEILRVPDMAHQYGRELTENEVQQMDVFLKVLVDQANNEKDSDQVLCFGYFVEAYKT